MLSRIWSLVSVVLALAVALLCLRSYGHGDEYRWTQGQELRTVGLFPGGISYDRYYRRGDPPEKGFSLGFTWIEYGAPAQRIANAHYVRPSVDWTTLGFAYQHNQWVSETQTSGNWTGKTLRAIAVGDPAYQQVPNLVEAWRWHIPLWPALVLLLWTPVKGALRSGIWSRRGRRRALKGQCPHCGYDLRAAIDRCPECGAAVVVVRVTDPPAS